MRRRGAGRCGCGGKKREGGLGKYFKYIFPTVTDADEQEELFISNYYCFLLSAKAAVHIQEVLEGCMVTARQFSLKSAFLLP